MKILLLTAFCTLSIMSSWGKTFIMAGPGANPIPNVPTTFWITVNKLATFKLIVDDLTKPEEAQELDTLWQGPVGTSHEDADIFYIQVKALREFIGSELAAQFRVNGKLHSQASCQVGAVR